VAPAGSETRDLGGETEGLRGDFEDVHLEQVPRLRAGHVHRPGQRVHDAEAGLRHLRQRRILGELSVQRVPGLYDDLVTGITLQDGRDIGVPAIVPRLGLGGQGRVRSIRISRVVIVGSSPPR
jgi:hypothetical protein